MPNKNLFIGRYPTGLVFCDKARDYLQVAFMPYSTLEVEWRNECSAEMHEEIIKHVETMRALRGERFQIEEGGTFVILGKEL